MQPDFDTLLDALFDPDPEKRLHAVKRLGEIKDPIAVEPLMYLYRDEFNPEIGKQIISAIENIGIHHVIMPFYAHLFNEDEADWLLILLSELGSQETINVLFHYPTFIYSKMPYYEISRWFVEAFSKVGEHTVQKRILVEAAQHPSPIIRANVARFLSFPLIPKGIIDEKITEIALNLLTDNFPRTREWAAIFFTGGYQSPMRDLRAVQPLLQLLNDNDLDVRDQAIRALLHQGHEAVKQIETFIHTTDVDSRWFAEQILDELQHPKRNDFCKLLEPTQFYWDQIRDERYADWYIEFQKHYSRSTTLEADAKAKYGSEAYNCMKCGTVASKLHWIYYIHSFRPRYRGFGAGGWLTVCNQCNIVVNFFKEFRLEE